MITQPTTLILGAGASADYQYPTGSRLKKEILLLLRGNPKKSMLLRNYGNQHKIKEFCDEFEISELSILLSCSIS